MDAMEDRPRRMKSTISQVRKQKGRGFRETADTHDDRNNIEYETYNETRKGAQKSVEGWVIIAANIHEEATEEDVVEAFMEFGDVKNVYLNLDRRTGFAKGYVLIEYELQEEAQSAIDAMNNSTFLEQILQVGWCFATGKSNAASRRR